MVIDAIGLEDWLGISEAVAASFSRDVLGIMPPTGVRSTSEMWEEYSTNFQPALTEGVLLADRQPQADQLLSELRGGPSSSRWQADSSQEVIAFALAAIRKAEPEVQKFIEARTLVVETTEAARQLTQKKGMIFLVKTGALNSAGPLAQRNKVIVPIGRDNPEEPGATLLERPTTEALAEAIQTMGLNEEQAQSLARNCGRSVTILARRIASTSAQKPAWAGQRQLLPALLAGGWNTRSEQDRQALAELSGAKDYQEYESELLPFLRSDDPPLDREGDVWKVRAPVDAFTYLGHLIGGKELSRLASTVKIVFGETDPSLELPDKERLYAGIYGKNLKYSNWLRTGLATTLRIMAVLGLTNPADQPGRFVAELVASLPGLETDYRRIASLQDVLPILMEAAPRPLLAALERMLEGGGKVFAPIFQDKDPFLSRSPHTGLLWGLEALAWDPHYLNDSALVLAKLARIDPGGKLTNRPLNSLREIFLSWHPSTNANLIQRMAALDQVCRREPEVGWQLIVKLLPGLHEIASPTAKPRYLEAGASGRELLTYALVDEGRRQIVERAFKVAGDVPERWSTIVGELSAFESPQRIKAAELLQGVAERLDDDQRTIIWSSLREVVARHKTFPSAVWAMRSADIVPLEELVVKLQPADPIKRIVWLFSEYHPAIPEPETPTFDRVDRAREEATRDLLKVAGTEGLLKLADSATHPEFVALSSSSVLRTVEDFATLIHLAMNKTDNLAMFASALSSQAERKIGTDWHSQMLLWRSERRWTHKQLADLVLNWKDERTTWDLLIALGPEVNRSYWERKRPWPLQRDEVEDLVMAANNYLAVGRAIGAIQALHYSASRIPAEILFEILDAALIELNESKAQVTNDFVYDLEQIFDALQNRTEVPIFEIAKREYSYLPLFQYRDRPLTLYRVMAEEPQFYAGLLRDAFKPRNREVPEPTEGQRGVARVAYRLLSEFRSVPGVVESRVDPQVLESWVQEVRRLAKIEDRSEIGDEFIGHMLANAPFDEDGAWPHRAVRDLIEKLASKELEVGIEVERFNMRGPHARAIYGGGEPEREIAQQIRAWTRKTLAWPRTTATLERLAESWELHGRQQDERASQDKMRYE